MRKFSRNVTQCYSYGEWIFACVKYNLSKIELKYLKDYKL